MNFKIGHVDNKSKWIFITCDNWDEPDGMVSLVKSIQREIGGSVINVVKDDTIYALTNDKYNLKFQWDDCFGTVVILDKMSDKDAVLELLEKHFKLLNHNKD